MQILWTRCGAIMAASDSATMALVMAKDRRAIGGGLRTLIPYAPRTRDGRPGGNNCLSRRGELHGGHRTPDYEVVLQGRAGSLRASAVRGPRPNWITLPAVDCHLAAQTRSLTSRACARIDGNKIPKWGGPPRFPTIFARKMPVLGKFPLCLFSLQ